MTSIGITEVWNGPGRRDGVLTTVEPHHNGWHPSPSRMAFEHWYFDAQLDSGHVVVGFLIKRRPEDLPWARPWVELIVYTPDGDRLQTSKRYSPAATSFSADRCDVRIGDNRAWSEVTADGLPRHHVRLAEGGLAFELTFENETPAWMPGKGETRFAGGESFGWMVGAPRARVHGTLEIDGRRSTVTGRGYADHNWGTGDMKRIIDRWHWGRLYTDDYSLLYAQVLTQPRQGSHAIAPLMLACQDEVVLSTGEAVLTEGPKRHDPIAGRDYPEWIELRVPDQLDLRLTVDAVIHAHDLLDDVPVVRSRALRPLLHRLIGHPAYFRFRSTFELTVHNGAAPYRESGTTLHELVALR
ncbi:lipocalin-like domain-containing protein [Nocardia sp. NPDC004151]|uniref:lipocalin-like domain-containing protein n=1 Tax=Nocardia sp. NPDC004151 TaxID=3364304 RepID=UPI0036807B9E